MLSRNFVLGLFSAVLGLTFMAPGVRPVQAQDRGTMEPRQLPPLADPTNPGLPAKQVFGRATEPSAMQSHVYGFYAKGCVAGARPLPMDGPDWQVMRPSRDRYWGHPALIDFIARLANRVHRTTDWPGILIGDMSQPRGGPMMSGHASHQIGLDVDVWLRPMPDQRLSREEREFLDSLMVVRGDRKDVDPRLFTRDTMNVIKAAATDPDVQRIFVNAAIKRAICRDARGDRSWLAKVRPMFGHDYHFHVRLYCPQGEASCQPQAEVGGGDGCDASFATLVLELDLAPRPVQEAAVPEAAAHHGLHAGGLPRRCGGARPAVWRAIGRSFRGLAALGPVAMNLKGPSFVDNVHKLVYVCGRCPQAEPCPAPQCRNMIRIVP